MDNGFLITSLLLLNELISTKKKGKIYTTNNILNNIYWELCTNFFFMLPLPFFLSHKSAALKQLHRPQTK